MRTFHFFGRLQDKTCQKIGMCAENESWNKNMKVKIPKESESLVGSESFASMRTFHFFGTLQDKFFQKIEMCAENESWNINMKVNNNMKVKIPTKSEQQYESENSNKKWKFSWKWKFCLNENFPLGVPLLPHLSQPLTHHGLHLDHCKLNVVFLMTIKMGLRKMTMMMNLAAFIPLLDKAVEAS